MIKLLALCSFLFGLFIVTLYYPFSSKLKFLYFDIKNIYSDDGKYLKHYNENGIWIKDEINNEIYIINGSTKKDNYLENVFLTKFNKNFDIIENIFSAKVDISSNNWILEKPTLFKNNKQIKLEENLSLNSNFNINKIISTFRDLN